MIARWRPEQFVEISARDVARANPWAGIPGLHLPRRIGAARGRRGRDVLRGRRARSRRPAVQARRHARDRRRQRARAARPSPRGRADAGHARRRRALEGAAFARDDAAAAGGAASSGRIALSRLHRRRRRCGRGSPTSYRYGPNRIDLGGTPVDVGFSIDLTIDPDAAGARAAHGRVLHRSRRCLSRAGHDGARKTAPRPSATDCSSTRRCAWPRWRVIDVESGRIEALAGALSPCTRQEYDGPGRSARCDKRLPYPIRYRPDALLNAAVFHDAMPGSTIKPIMAAAFLADPRRRADVARRRASGRARPLAHRVPSADSLRGQLARSNSARFLDRMFCADKGFRLVRAAVGNPGDGARLRLERRVRASERRVRQARSAVRARRRCALARTASCDALALGVPVRASAGRARGGKLAAPFRLRPEIALDPAKCSNAAPERDGRRLTRDDWEKCGGGVVGRRRRRRLGTGPGARERPRRRGHDGDARRRRERPDRGARAAPRGGAARRGAGRARRDSSRRRCASGSPTRSRIAFAHDAAEVIISGLSFSHRAGTARLACEQVFDAAHVHPDGLDRGQDRHADVSQRRPLAFRPCAIVRAGVPPKSAARPRRVRTAAAVQVVRRRLPNRSQRSALDEGDRRADRAQLARRHGARSRRRAITGPIPRPRSRCRSPAATRACCRGARSETRVRRADPSPHAHPRSSADRSCGRSTARSRRVSPTSKTRCDARSCRSATSRRSRS